MAELKNIILDTKEEELEKMISPFIQNQFPSFMRKDYDKMILFVKAYYEWMEKKGNPGYAISNLNSMWDTDKNLDEFYDSFKRMYLESFPDFLATNSSGNKPNKRTLLKHIRDFYGNKGTESAYKFLFRILYDSDVELYYPKSDILRISDGQWIEPKSIKTTSINGNALFSAKNGQIFQYTDEQVSASAFINGVVQYSFDGYPITEFFITDITGNFAPEKTVYIVKDSYEWTETPYSVLGEFFVELPGSGYRIGDTVTVIDPLGRGIGFSAKIDQIGLAGGVKKIGISNSGINYSSNIVVSIFSETGTQSARVLALQTAVTNYPGYFSGNRGKLSSNKKIQDGHYYQDFSYVLKSEVSFDSYFEVLKRIVHPAGLRMFGSILIKKSLANAVSSSSQGTNFENPIIGRYAPYTPGTTLNLRANGVTTAGYWLGATGDLYPLGYNPFIGSTSEVGPNGTTTPNGTVFVGSSLGYTWCYVPERGRTSHNPIGSPLGSTSSWYSARENNFQPNTLSGLVLWLKPENIGVCGSVATGASLEIWRDASASNNDALPPTWDKWNGIAELKVPVGFTTGYFDRAVWDQHNPITRVSFSFNGTGGGFTFGRVAFVGFSESPTSSNQYYTSLRYSFYSYGPNPSNPTALRTVYAFNHSSSGEVTHDSVLLRASTQNEYAIYDNHVFEMEYIEPFVVFRINGSEVRRFYEGYGKTFYLDSSFYASTDQAQGMTVTIHEISNRGMPVVPRLTSGTGMAPLVWAGVTIDKLRPTLVLNSPSISGGSNVAGATGVAFDVSSSYSLCGPQTSLTSASSHGLPTGITLGKIGITFGPGSSGEMMISSRFLVLRKPLILKNDMDAFLVIRMNSDANSGAGYSVIASSSNFTGPLCVFPGNEDQIIGAYSWNQTDRTPASQNSTGSYSFVNGVKGYYGHTSSFWFRPYGGTRLTNVSTANRTHIAYDPHVSNVSVGRFIGEFSRDKNFVIYAYHNGDRATNRSPSTGLPVRKFHDHSLGSEVPNPICGVSVDIGRIGGYHLNTVTKSNSNPVGSSAWLTQTQTGFGIQGVVNEFIVYDRKLSETERQEVYGYLSRKYRDLEQKLPDSYSRSHGGARVVGSTYWVVEHHPNNKGLSSITAGISFSGITLMNFLKMPDTIYKSKGTVQSDGTVLSDDTYSNL